MTERVWIANLSATNPDVYHTQESCANGPQTPRRVSIEYVERRDMRECKTCQGIQNRTNTQYHYGYQQLEALDPSDL